MAHEKNVTTTFREKFPNSPFDFAYNRIGTEHESTKHSQHPRHLNPRYMQKFDTIAEAEKEAQSISKSYDRGELIIPKPKPKPIPPGGKEPSITDFPVVDIMARLIWGEAEGEGAIGMQAVGNVIMNRVDAKSKYGADAQDIIMEQNQFSAIDDPERIKKMMDLTEDNIDYIQALEISKKLLAGELEDITNGATHYYNPKTANINQDWIKQYPITYEHGKHIFAKGNF